MTWKFPAANKLAVSLVALVAVGFATTQASAQQKYDNRGRPTYGSNGPNVSYQQGPPTRIFMGPDAPGSTLAPKCCRATASSPTTPTRRSSATRRSRARTTIGRSTASRSTRRRIWVGIRGASRCIDCRDNQSTSSRLKAGTTMRRVARLRVQRLQLLQNRFAHLRGTCWPRALGPDVRGAQAARQHRRDRGIELVGERAHVKGIAQRHSERGDHRDRIG